MIITKQLNPTDWQHSCDQCGAVTITHKPNLQHGCRSKRTNVAPPVQSMAIPFRFRPGNVLAWMIRYSGFSLEQCSGCNRRRRQMNDWGWFGCWSNRETIRGWIRERTEKYKIDVSWYTWPRWVVRITINWLAGCQCEPSRVQRRCGSKRRSAYLLSRRRCR